MKPNQKLAHNGAQVALLPMEYLRITQGRNGQLSHQGIDAYDLAGQDGGIDKWYAPFDIEVMWLDVTTKTGVVVANTANVLLANGKIQAPYTMLIMLWHDNDISSLRIGQKYEQGQYFYSEGTRGYATGNHIHMELAYGKYDGQYPLFQMANKNWTLKGEALRIEDAFYINDTKVLRDLGYKFKKFTAPKNKYEAEVYAFTSTADKNINIRENHNTKAKIVGQLKKGQTYDYIQKYNDGKHVWVSNGKTWVAVREVKDGKRQELWGTLQAQKAPVKPSKPKEKWLRIPTTISTYAYYMPNQKNKVSANKAGTLRPINYKHLAKFIEYKVIAEKDDFKTIQLHGEKANPEIDIFTGKGTEHAWEIFYK